MIDLAAKGSIAIYKYDETAAEADGKASAIAAMPTNGMKNDATQAALAKYALKGIQFSYLKVADITTYVNDDNLVQLGYTLDNQLATILGLTTANSIDGASMIFSPTTVVDAMQSKLTVSTFSNTATKNALEDYVVNSDTAKGCWC